MTTCKDCDHAMWSLTPTGRIRDKAGRCVKQEAMFARLLAEPIAPCFTRMPPRRVSIWPDYAAGACPMFQAKELRKGRE